MLSTVSAHTALPTGQTKQAPLRREEGEPECTESRKMKLHPCTASLFLKLTVGKKKDLHCLQSVL